MKTAYVFIIIISITSLFAAMPPQWNEFQRDLGIQAASFRDLPNQKVTPQKDTRNYNIGDTEVFWRWNLSVMPPTWNQTTATCRAVGEHCYVFVANSDWGSHMTQANVDEVLARLEDSTPNDPTRGAIEMDVDLFGPVPNVLDNDPKLIVFYSALGSFQGTSFDGYFSPYNQVTEAQAQQMNPSGHSNECEMIYMTCYPLDPVAPVRLSVLSHELQHLIHWGMDANEETWLNEGCAELAMVAYGVPDPITGFPTNPDNNLTAWNQSFADYVKVMLFFTYLQEHFDDTGMISSLVASPENGMASLETKMALYYPLVTVPELIRLWTVANYLDEVNVLGEMYNYEQLNLPTFSSVSVNQYPSQTNQTLQAFAADYLRYTVPATNSSFFVEASAPVYVSALVYNAQDVCVSMAVLYGTEVGWGALPAGAAKIVFVLTNSHSTGVTYSYLTAPVGITDPLLPPAQLSLETYPNPYLTGAAALTIKAGSGTQPSELSIYNLRGQLIRSLKLSGGAQSLEWDGKDTEGCETAAGVYTLVLRSGKSSLSKRITILN